MALKYLYSGAAGAGTGADWTNAYTTIALAIAGLSAGDQLNWAHDHNESLAAGTTVTFPGTLASPNTVLCVNRAGSVPPVSADLRTTGSLVTTGANALTVAGSVESDGVSFSAGTGATNVILSIGTTSNSRVKLKNCALTKAGTTGIVTAISLGAANGARVELDNVTMQFGAATDGVTASARAAVLWTNTASAIQGATLPTTLIGQLLGGEVTLRGVDLSALGAGKNLCVATMSGIVRFVDCKLGASVNPWTPTVPQGVVYIIRSDSSGTNYRGEKYTYRGTQTVETTIVRTGGATDRTTPLSRKIVTTANARWAAPFDDQPVAVWNDTIAGNITVTLEGTWNSASLPLNDEIWIDVEYLGDASSPLASRATQTKADFLATGSALTTSAAAWGGGGSGAGWSPFKLAKTFTAPAQKGWVYVYVRAGKASATYYVDPLVTVT